MAASSGPPGIYAAGQAFRGLKLVVVSDFGRCEFQGFRVSFGAEFRGYWPG